MVGDEHEHGVRGRLLQRLQKRVGALGAKQMRIQDQIDAAGGLERAHVQVAAKLAGGVDQDRPALGLQQE
jgi:hypothetical protein